MSFNKFTAVQLAAERAIMGATMVKLGGQPLPTVAAKILAQVYKTNAKQHIYEAVASMFLRGAIDKDQWGLAIRFEHLALENRALIRRRQQEQGYDFGWPELATPPEKEPSLPIRAFDGQCLRRRLRESCKTGLITADIRYRIPRILEIDYLAMHPASFDGPYRSLSYFHDNPGLYELLHDEDEDSLVYRNGELCVPWDLVEAYMPIGSSPLEWELPSELRPIPDPV